VFCLNELPDLAERIQVALLNVLEERDIGVRGYALRLPLDLVLVASANPEDYTNRGRIITPLKDRFGAEIRTHYPISLSAELALIKQEADVAWDTGGPATVLPEHLIQVIARFTRLVRASPAVDSRSGVSARFAIAAAEAVAASAVRRAAITGEEQPAARVCDLSSIVTTLRGKVEFEVSEEGRENEVLEHLLRRAIAETFRGTLGSADLSGLLAKFEDGGSVESGDLVSAPDLLRSIGELPGLARIMDRARHGRRRVARRGAAARVRHGRPVPDAAAVQGQRRRRVGVPRLRDRRDQRCLAVTGTRQYHDGPDPLEGPYDIPRRGRWPRPVGAGRVDPSSAA
jgi:magnesium chelatase subunit I